MTDLRLRYIDEYFHESHSLARCSKWAHLHFSTACADVRCVGRTGSVVYTRTRGDGGHRALGLKTFQAFSAVAADSHTKDAVLMETTHSIFGNITTGLINESSNCESDSNIIQIAGKVMEQAGGK